MKKTLTLLAGLCILVPGLSGCSAILNREYASSSLHVEYPVGEQVTVLQAENDQGLVNALLYFVTEHEEEGIIRLSRYAGEARVAQDLRDACLEVRTEDPLGAYAVEEIACDYTPYSAHYEVTVRIAYARTAEETAAITPAAGSSAIRQIISSSMAAFAPTCVFRVSYFTGDDASLLQLARQTWLDTPLAALAEPEVGVNLYPGSGTGRIVELTLDWPESPQELAARSAALEQQALALLESVELPPEELTPLVLLSALRRHVAYHPQGGDTAYAALVEGRGNARGIVQALRLLCQLADLEATVAEGALDGQPRFWLIVSTPEGYRHLDPASAAPAYATDDAQLAGGYQWEEGRYPACTDYTATLEPTGPEEDGEPPREEEQ